MKDVEMMETQSDVIFDAPPTTMSSTDLCGEAIVIASDKINEKLAKCARPAAHSTTCVPVPTPTHMRTVMCTRLLRMQMRLTLFRYKGATLAERASAAIAAGEDLSAPGSYDAPKLW